MNIDSFEQFIISELFWSQVDELTFENARSAPTIAHQALLDHLDFQALMEVSKVNRNFTQTPQFSSLFQNPVSPDQMALMPVLGCS